MSGIQIRPAVPADREVLGKMRHALWPDSSVKHHEEELAPILAGKPPGIMSLVYFVAQDASAEIVGFVEVGLRSTADGCDWARAVGYVEGWYVAESYRRRKVGAQLIAAGGVRHADRQHAIAASAPAPQLRNRRTLHSVSEVS